MKSTYSHSKVRVELLRTVDDSYDIHIGCGLFARLGELLPRALGRQVAVVSDSNVFTLHGKAFCESLRAAGYEVAVEAVFPAGESAKTRDTKAWIEDRLLDARLGRDSWIAAFGGGVVGDMAGYTAATFLRGVPFVQFPTTLLAMVDSSVGGKTGVDTPHGKNLIGAFWQPRAVVADLGWLTTLPKDEFGAGMAEVVKHAIIADADLFATLDAEWRAIEARETATLERIVERNCAIKAAVVARDEREGDLRKILNFGHTLGHAIETAAEYRLLHGVCVAIGMRYEGALAAKLGLWSEADAAQADALLDKAGFVRRDDLEVSSQALVALTRQDKKARAGRAEYVFPSGLGAMHRAETGYGVRVEEGVVLEVLRAVRGR